jgi:outer membrane protein TolC
MKKNLILPDLSRITKKLLDVLLILLIAGIGSCNLAPVFQKPDQDIYDNFKYKAFADSLSSISIDTVWWKYFEDTTLDNIIRQVSLNNNNLQAALYSFEQANILTRVERSPLLPEVQT